MAIAEAIEIQTEGLFERMAFFVEKLVLDRGVTRWFITFHRKGLAVMRQGQEAEAAFFDDFSLKDHVPQDHLLRSIDRFVDLTSIRAHLAEFYGQTRRPSIKPEQLIRVVPVAHALASGPSGGSVKRCF